MSETKLICPSCQQALPPDVPLGLCPECLIKSGFPTGTAPGNAGPDFIPPTIEEVAKAFPQFEIIGLLGKGGMGAVYQARQPGLDRLVALKILPPLAGKDPGFAERFSREARALARLNHPNIVGVHDSGQAGGLYYLVMEFVDGANLREVGRAGRLPPKQTLQIVSQICDALQFAHDEGIIHRDIKPENILLDKKGRVKIADFGIAKIIGATPERIGLTGARDFVGTLHYIAPEQIEQPNAVDHRADIYSLGVVFYELLTGELPFGRFPLPSSKVSVDVRLDDVVVRALQKEPERRYQHASEVKTDVQAITDAPPPLVSSPAGRQATAAIHQNTRGSFWKLAVIGVVALMVLLAVVVIGAWFFVRPQPLETNAQLLAPLQVDGPDQHPPLLRYRWTPGGSDSYAVQFVADTGDAIETTSGNVTYTVRSVSADVATLACWGQMGRPLRSPKPGRPLGNPFPTDRGNFWPESSFNSSRQVQVDSDGKFLERSGPSTQLPQALGNLEDLIFEPLPPAGQKTWEDQHDCVIRLTKVVPIAPMSSFGRPEETTYPAREKSSYQFGPTSNGVVQIQKRYDLKSQELASDQPRIQLAGEGTITFDTMLGRPRMMEFKGVFTETSGNTTLRTPVTLNYRRLEGRGSTNATALPAATQIEPKELTATELREALNDLKSSDRGRKLLASAILAEAKPAETRSNVVSALVSALGDSNWAVRQNATRALGIWATAEAYPPLIKMLDDPEFSVRWKAIDALTQWKNPPTAAALAGHMTQGLDILETGRALRTLGGPAEEAVAGLLNATNTQVRYEACRILQDNGTKKSIPALTTAAGDADGITAMLAKEALKAIDAR